MAGTVTLTWTGHRRSAGLMCYTLAWISDGSGIVLATFTEISGTIEGIAFAPGTGTEEPDDNYDVTLCGRDGFDVLRGKGANLDEAVATEYNTVDGTPVYPYPTSGPLDLSISSAGAAKTGTIRLYVRT